MTLRLSWRRLSMVALGLAISAGAGMLTSVSPRVGVMAIAATGLVVLLFVSGSPVLAVLMMSATVDLLTRFKVGPISAMGLLTILYAFGSWFGWALRPRLTPGVTRAMVPLTLYLAWGAASAVIWYRPVVDGLQNLLAMAAFSGLLLLSAREAQSPTGSAADAAGPWFQNVGRVLAWASWVAGGFWMVSAAFGSHLGGLGIGTRTYALFALIGLAWFVAGWRTGSRISLLAAVGILILLALGLSRTALVVGLALFPLAQVRLNRLGGWLRLAVWGLLAAAILYVGISYVTPLQARFFQGDTSLHLFGLQINTEGRIAMWQVTWNSYLQSPWIGKGAGSAEVLINANFPGLGHPHNDYLRILHDYGLVGFALWFLGFVSLAWRSWRGWVDADDRGDPAGRVHLAAFLALVALMLSMLTDNVVSYVFVLAPAAILIGTSLGALGATVPAATADGGAAPPEVPTGRGAGVLLGARPRAAGGDGLATARQSVRSR